MCRVILSPTDLFQIDSKDCIHLIRVRCQLLILFLVKNNEILFTVVTRLYYWNTLLTKIWNHWNVYVRTCVRFKACSTKGLLTFCTSLKTTGLLFFIPGNGDSRERCVPLGIVLSDYNPRSGSSGPALHTGKNTRAITGGGGQTKNVTETLLQFPGQALAISAWVKREVFIEGCQTKGWINALFRNYTISR